MTVYDRFGARTLLVPGTVATESAFRFRRRPVAGVG
jgi:hypothetical protein